MLWCRVWVHWLVDGPRTVKGFLDRVRTAAYAGLLPYQAECVQYPGFGERFAVCRVLRLLLELLCTLVETGHVDVSSFAVTALRVRRRFQIDLAVERYFRSPGFVGLDVFLDTVDRPSGGLSIPSWSRCFSDILQEEAFAL